MSRYLATVHWERGDAVFTDNAYSRGHVWQFDGGLSVAASSSPDVVPLPMSVAENVDPEEAFVASLSSCHMLFFLSLAQKRGIIVDQYVDRAVGRMTTDEKGRMAVTTVTLNPDCVYIGDKQPSLDALEKMHHRAHELCFIANSVKTDISINIVA